MKLLLSGVCLLLNVELIKGVLPDDEMTPVRAQCDSAVMVVNVHQTAEGPLYEQGACWWVTLAQVQSNPCPSSWLCNGLSSTIEGHPAWLTDRPAMDIVTRLTDDTMTTNELLVGLKRVAAPAPIASLTGNDEQWYWKDTCNETQLHGPVPKESVLWKDPSPVNATSVHTTVTAAAALDETAGALVDRPESLLAKVVCQFNDYNAVKSFNEDPWLRDRRMQPDATLVLAVLSDMDTFVKCLRQCNAKKICHSFAHSETEGLCELHHASPKGLGLLLSTPGWRWYRLDWN